MGLTPRPTPIFPWVEESEVRKLFCSRIQHRSSSRGLEVEFLHRFSNLVLTGVIGKVISKKKHFLRFNFFTKLPFDSWLDSLEAFVNCRLNYLLNFFVCSKDKRFINRFIKFSTSAVDMGNIDYFMVGECVRFLCTSCEESQTNERVFERVRGWVKQGLFIL